KISFYYAKRPARPAAPSGRLTGPKALGRYDLKMKGQRPFIASLVFFRYFIDSLGVRLPPDAFCVVKASILAGVENSAKHQ
ncbi:MAG: hypothetical protein IJ461_04190, partial [Clostridia bacterium]|nr:hypothetical protein [Clostridia bacterium]